MHIKDYEYLDLFLTPKQGGWARRFSGVAMAMREAALNLLDFFASFFYQEKNED